MDSVEEIPEEAPSPGPNMLSDTVDTKHVTDIDDGEGEALVIKEEGQDGAYIVSTVTVADFEP